MRAPAALVLLWSWLLAAPAGAAPPLLFVPAAGDVPPYKPPLGEEPEPAPLDLRPRFLGSLESDDEVLARLCTVPVRSIGPLGGGASISLKAVLMDGSLAAVKPEQSHVTRYNAEV